ncbi:MAG: glycosyl hydrolase family 28 protein [Luteolibacter sp.]|uniref:glycoside hydrolase family 28 protein n=1 Tax=Luteolibacter sp. TaxID=1962973 RepID=UPI003266FA86
MHRHSKKLLFGLLPAMILGGSRTIAGTLPSIPLREIDIVSAGAVPDGMTSCTSAIRNAIEKTRDAGGGRVMVPAGRFLTGPITLYSNIDLHLAKDAILLMDPTAFPAVNNERPAMIHAGKAHDIRLSGEGTIDGQGEVWWKPFREEKAKGVKDAPRRPQLISFNQCERLEVRGITTLNPPNTHYSIKQCGDVTIKDITATAPNDSPNTDALNLSGVRNVLITGCNISTGDDNIVLLCSAAKEPGVPEVENVTIRDCKLGFGHGLSIGSYTSGGVRNVTAENISFDGTTSGIRMKAWRDRGGVVEGIHYRNITMRGVRYPVFISSYYPQEPAGPAKDLPANGATKNPVWRNIEISDVTISGSKNSIILWGLPDEPITNVSLKNIKASSQVGALVFHAKGIDFSGVEIASVEGSPLRLFDAKISGMTGTETKGEEVKFK